MTVYIRGEFVCKERATISVWNRGFLFGDGAYATLKVERGYPLFFKRHLEKLQQQCLALGIVMPACSLETVLQLIAHNQAHEGVWRLRIVVAAQENSLNRLPERGGELILLLDRYDHRPPSPLRLGIFPTPFNLCHASFKSLAHLNRYYVMEEAFRQGRDDCITVTESGIVLETAFGNLFWVDEGVLYTPSPHLPLHFGVTISQIVESALSRGMRVEKVERVLEELPERGSCFRCNTLGGIVPIQEIGEKKFLLSKEEEREWVEAYQEIVEGEVILPLPPALLV